MELFHQVVAPPTAERLLLLVHGFGSDETDLAQILPHLDPGGRFAAVLPRGPLAAGEGSPGYSWFPLAGERPSAEDRAALLERAEALGDLVAAVAAEHGLDPAAAILGGFSQGASMAALTALRPGAPVCPAGVLMMCTAVPGVEDFGPDWEAVRDTPFLVQNGSQDPIVSVAASRRFPEELHDHGVPCTYRLYPMGHHLTIESIEDARGWLDAVCAGERPSETMPEPPPEPLVRAVTTAEFETEVLRSEVPVVVDFWAPWCGPCRQVAPVIEQMAAMRKGSYRFVKVNIDDEPQLAEAFEVQSIPLIGLFRNGRLERVSLGAKARPQLEAELGMLVIP